MQIIPIDIRQVLVNLLSMRQAWLISGKRTMINYLRVFERKGRRGAKREGKARKPGRCCGGEAWEAPALSRSRSSRRAPRRRRISAATPTRSSRLPALGVSGSHIDSLACVRLALDVRGHSLDLQWQLRA